MIKKEMGIEKKRGKTESDRAEMLFSRGWLFLRKPPPLLCTLLSTGTQKR